MLKKTLLALTALSAITLVPHNAIIAADAAVKVTPVAAKTEIKTEPKYRTILRVRPKADGPAEDAQRGKLYKNHSAQTAPR